MKLRDALIQQSPSLALQRAAADELAVLDKEVLELEDALALAHAHYSLMVNFIIEQGLKEEYNEWLETITQGVEVH